jgi:hypothetical protein
VRGAKFALTISISVDNGNQRAPVFFRFLNKKTEKLGARRKSWQTCAAAFFILFVI